MIGEVTERVDANPDDLVNGAPGKGSSVSGMCPQHHKVGLWLMGDNDNLVVETNTITQPNLANGIAISNHATVRNTGTVVVQAEAPPPSATSRPPVSAPPGSTTAPTRPTPAPSPSPTAAATPAGAAPGPEAYLR